MSTIAALIVIVIIIVALAIAYLVVVDQRTQRLQERVGPEYDRAVDEAGSRRAAATPLRERREDETSQDVTPGAASELEGQTDEGSAAAAAEDTQPDR